MASILRRLRISIVAMSFIVGILLIAYYAYIFVDLLPPGAHLRLLWPAITEIVVTILVFGAYIFAVCSRQFVHRFIRALLLLALAILWLYINIHSIFIHMTYICPSMDYICGISRAVEVFSIMCGALVTLEVIVTLKSGGLAQISSVTKPQPDVVYVTPTQQQPFTPSYPAPYYPQQPYQHPVQQAQPYPVVMQQAVQYEASHMYGNYQQPYPYAAPGFSAASSQVPGSMITTTPQPGRTPIAPYPSPGNSVAVSPVLPVGGYSIASASGR